MGNYALRRLAAPGFDFEPSNYDALFSFIAPRGLDLAVDF